jgi:hypothetical protein
MTISNRITLDALRQMPIGDIVALPAEPIALLHEEADAAASLDKTIIRSPIDGLNRAVRPYGPGANARRRLRGADRRAGKQGQANVAKPQSRHFGFGGLFPPRGPSHRNDLYAFLIPPPRLPHRTLTRFGAMTRSHDPQQGAHACRMLFTLFLASA